MIEKFLQDIHFNPNPNKNTKQLALEAVKLLKDGGVSIERVQIRVRVSMDVGIGKKVFESVMGLVVKLEEEVDWSKKDFEMVRL